MITDFLFSHKSDHWSTPKEWLEHWLQKQIDANSLNELMDAAIKEGHSVVTHLIDKIMAVAMDLSVSNPLTYGRIHRSGNIQAAPAMQTLGSIRKRFLSRQEGR